MRRLASTIVFFFLICVTPSQAQYSNPTLGDGKTPSIIAIDWCLRFATSKLYEMNHGACRRAALDYGLTKHQSDLGHDAIVSLCRGENGRAIDQTRACQCHNEGYMPGVVSTIEIAAEWAQNHPICIADRKARNTTEPVVTPPPPPPVEPGFLAVKNITCAGSYGGTGSVEPNLWGFSCEEARQEVQSIIDAVPDLCQQQLSGSYKVTGQSWVPTGTCP